MRLCHLVWAQEDDRHCRCPCRRVQRARAVALRQPRVGCHDGRAQGCEPGAARREARCVHEGWKPGLRRRDRREVPGG